MNNNESQKKSIIVILIATAMVITSIPIAFIMISDIQEKENILIKFTPNQMKSCPNHTAWLLLNINTKTSSLMANLSVQINTNISIEMEYEIWENSPLNTLVEVFLYPNNSHIDNLIEIEATISSGGISKKDYAIVQVINWTIIIYPEIIAMRDEFVNYLSINYSNIRINGTTLWERLGNMPQILVVEHYLFK